MPIIFLQLLILTKNGNTFHKVIRSIAAPVSYRRGGLPFSFVLITKLAAEIKTSYPPIEGSGSTWKELSVESEMRGFDY